MGWFKSVTNFVTAPFVEPVKAIKKVAEGDYYGAADSLVKTATMGTVGLPSVKMPDSGDSTPDTTSPEQQIVDAKADSVKRRRALYATKGGSKGEEVESVGDTFGNGRGTLFGN